jgi:dinuclear metal center YbgI/SA1388 family protein
VTGDCCEEGIWQQAGKLYSHMPTAAEITQALYNFAPPELATEGDNVGLQVGDLQTKVKRLLVALEVTPGLIAWGRSLRAQMAVVHHPVIFTPLSSLTTNSYPERLIIQAVKADLTILSLPTNLDHTAGGLNDRLGELAGLKVLQPLIPLKTRSLIKLAVFVPKENQTEVREAMSRAGAGRLGNYSDCSFRIPGSGTFKPLAGADPAIGKIGTLEEGAEDRLEMLVEKHRLPEVLAAMKAAHPYEVIAYDLYLLENQRPGAGMGRIGDLAAPTALKTLAGRISRKLQAPVLRLTGEGSRRVCRLAVGCGSVRGLVEPAMKSGADALLAGEIPHHERLQAEAEGLAVIEMGHEASERPAVWLLTEKLTQAFPKGLEITSYEPWRGQA